MESRIGLRRWFGFFFPIERTLKLFFMLCLFTTVPQQKMWLVTPSKEEITTFKISSQRVEFSV